MPEDNKQQQYPPNHIHCSPEKPSQYDLVLKQYGDALKESLKNASDLLITKATDASTKSSAVCTDRKISDKLSAALKEYNFLSICIGAYASKDLELLQTVVAEDVARYEALNTAYTAAVNAIKAAKQKIAKVNTLACKLKDAVPDSCNSEELKQIKECLNKNNNTGKGQQQPDSLEESVHKIVHQAHHITNQVDDLSESAVKVAGINAFINIASLTPAAALIKEKGTAFITDVDANLKALQTQYDTARQTQVDALKALSTATVDKYKAWIVKDGLAFTAEFVKDNDCDHDCRSLDEIAKEAEQSFNRCCGSDEEEGGGEENPS
jgi:hypothetical protein